MGILRNMLQKQGFEVGLLEQHHYIVMCTYRLNRLIKTLQETINLSFADVTNVELFSQKDLDYIIDHLRTIYPAKSIIHSDPYHAYENLKFTKTQVIMMNLDMVVILSVPITEGENYQLYSIYPIPSHNKRVLIPSDIYYLQGPTPKWSKAPCIKGTQLYVCVLHNVKTTACNVTNPASCEFAQTQNNVKIFQPANQLKLGLQPINTTESAINVINISDIMTFLILLCVILVLNKNRLY